jgi:beta-phosphoglucomutase
VLWDLDGTLADSKHYHWLSWRAVLEDEGVHVTHSDFEASFGQRNPEILTRWLGHGATPERIERIGAAKEVAYRELIQTNGLEPLPGAAEWVRALHTAGWRQAIASSAPRLNVEVMRRVLGFEDVIETWVGAEDVRVGKPDPEVFLTAAARLEVAAARCIVVEDAAAGIEAARRAGMPSIGVADGAGAANIAVLSLVDLAPTVFDDLLAGRDAESDSES